MTHFQLYGPIYYNTLKRLFMKCAVMMYIYMIVQHQVTFSILFIAQAPFKSYISIINIVNRIVFHRVKTSPLIFSPFQSMVTG